MRAIATTIVIGATAVSVTVLFVAATIASLITLGIHTWHQLLTVAAATNVLRVVSGFFGLLWIIGALAGMGWIAQHRSDIPEPS